MSDRREPGPRPVRDSLARVSRELGLGAPDAFSLVVARWPEVVGETVARHAAPRHLRDGVLAVLVDDGGWATQLRYAEAQVVARLVELGAPVAQLRVTVGRPS